MPRREPEPRPTSLDCYFRTKFEKQIKQSLINKPLPYIEYRLYNIWDLDELVFIDNYCERFLICKKTYDIQKKINEIYKLFFRINEKQIEKLKRISKNKLN